MIVYGDPSFSIASTELLPGFQARLSETERSPGLDLLRTLLIDAGQVEQALADATGIDAAHLAASAETTDACADAFFAAWDGSTNRASGVHTALQRAGTALQRLVVMADQPVRVKVPEGYAFYTLFPEQYAAAALQWDAAHPHGQRAPVLVVGVRSIGTSLSAVVAAAFRSRGWHARRATVRPTGHPYSREAALPAELCHAACGLVVDEGPGLSGSSMAAVAEAMVRGGIPRERITFLPGHSGEPGGSASAEVREWWAATSRLVTPAADLRWDGHSLTGVLARRTNCLLPDAGGRVARVEDLSGGLWRRAAYGMETSWPAVCTPFERTKYRCVLSDGRSVLWKFEGLAVGPDGRGMAEAAFRTQVERAARGWSPPPLDQAVGFVAMPWLEGERLTPADADPAMLERLALYIAQAAGPPLTPEQSSEASERLRELLYWNTWELLGEAAAEPLKHRVPSIAPADTPSHGDGHLAPHEWVRTPEGRIWKMDMTGHALDHTAVGAQPVWWDVAGAITEWRLDTERVRHFLAELRRHLPLEPAPELLSYYRAAYAAFRAGQCAMCAGTTADPSERQRLVRAAEAYRLALTRALSDVVRSH